MSEHKVKVIPYDHDEHDVFKPSNDFIYKRPVMINKYQWVPPQVGTYMVGDQLVEVKNLGDVIEWTQPEDEDSWTITKK